MCCWLYCMCKLCMCLSLHSSSSSIPFQKIKKEIFSDLWQWYVMMKTWSSWRIIHAACSHKEMPPLRLTMSMRHEARQKRERLNKVGDQRWGGVNFNFPDFMRVLLGGGLAPSLRLLDAWFGDSVHTQHLSLLLLNGKACFVFMTMTHLLRSCCTAEKWLGLCK